MLIDEESLEIGRWILLRHSGRLLQWTVSYPKKRFIGRAMLGTTLKAG